MTMDSVQFETLFAVPPRNGLYKGKEFQGRGIRLVKMNQLFGERRIRSLSEGYDRIELSEKERQSVLLKKGDLLFSRTSVVADGVGKCSLIVEADEDLAWDSNIIRIRLNTAIADPEFYFYFFNSPQGRDTVKRLSSGAAVTTITGTGLSKSVVRFTQLSIQRRIAGILSAYDDLIENNQRRIKILEEMARSLYREWFVHFRFPGHDKVKMVSSPLGPMPQGWEVKTIQQFGQVITGKTPSKATPEFYGEDMPFLKTPDMHGNMFILETGDRLSTSGAESQASKTIPAGSICVSCIGTIGVVSLTIQKCQTNQQINSVVLKEGVTREFLFLRMQDLKQKLENLGSTGATMGNVNKGKFESIEIIVPPDPLLGRYHQLVEPQFSQTLNLSRRIQNLRRTRDLMLPRLLSGEMPHFYA
jgi:type I restriction enzyme S subunit